MLRPPTKEDKQLIVDYVTSFVEALVPASALFHLLENETEMDHDQIVVALNELEVENRVWSLYIPEDNDHDLPAGEFFYRPSEDAYEVDEF